VKSENLSSPPALPSGKSHPKTSLAQQAANGSWASPLIIFLLLVLGRNVASPLVLDLIGLLLLLTGLSLGIAALFGIRKHGAKGILAPAVVGIVINGLLLLIFATNFFTARAKAKAQRDAPIPLAAESSDSAPFRILVPSSDWKLDSTPRKLHENALITATFVKTNSLLRSLVIRYSLGGTSDSILAKLSAEMRQGLSGLAVKNASEQQTKFLNLKAARFTYEMAQKGRVEYYDAVAFAIDNTGWAIVCVGPPDQKNEVEKMFDFYHSNAPSRP
jgi:hypothetical protein